MASSEIDPQANTRFDILCDDQHPDPGMPIFTRDHKAKQIDGEWGDLKPKVGSAMDYVKRTGCYWRNTCYRPIFRSA